MNTVISSNFIFFAFTNFAFTEGRASFAAEGNARIH